MILRLFHIAFAGICLLSLVGAVGVARLWWEYRHGRAYQADISFGKINIAAVGIASRLLLCSGGSHVS